MIDLTRPGLALFQPDIPGNTGALMRLAACTATTLHIIEPAGFRLDDTALKRSGMDYLDMAAFERHLDWQSFLRWRTEKGRRIVLLTTKAETSYAGFRFTAADVLLLGSESSGAPDYVHKAADHRIRIPMAREARSLNLALAGAMVLGEALRQTGLFEGR
jgi:tRNA (cytidine/uridine-2'-O-)-methyltransferase